MEALDRLRRSFERFAPLPEPVWAKVRRPWRLRTVERGDVLTREGVVERRFSLVLSGIQRAYFTAPDGTEHTVAFAYPGDYSGIPDSVFLREPSEYALDALSDGRVLETDASDLLALIDAHRALERWAWRLLASALRGRARRERRHLTLTAQERYERFLQERASLVQQVPLKHIASYLGMSPETLSRVRAALG
jgi:CRP-like cAMP-binding protein